jgi:hypothetical protein
MQSSINQTIEEIMCEEFDKIYKAIDDFEQEIELIKTKRLGKEFSKFGGVRE